MSDWFAADDYGDLEDWETACRLDGGIRKQCWPIYWRAYQVKRRPFDIAEFIEYPSVSINRYFDLFVPHEPQPSDSDVRKLWKSVEHMDEIHAIIVAKWAIERSLTNTADTVVSLIKSCRDNGGKCTLIMLLKKSVDMTGVHINAVRQYAKELGDTVVRMAVDDTFGCGE